MRYQPQLLSRGVAAGFLGGVIAVASYAPARVVQNVAQDRTVRQPTDSAQQRILDLQDVWANADHSIDILNATPGGNKGRLHTVMDRITLGRNQVLRELDDLTGGKASRDLQAQRQRDKEVKREGKEASKAGDLQTVMLWVQHAQETLQRQPADKGGHRAQALKAFHDAQIALQEELDQRGRRR